MTTHTVRKILLESFPILGIILVFALAAGQFLDQTVRGLRIIFPLILLMVPAFINITGDLAGVAGARVTSHLYTGELDPSFRPYSLLMANLFAVLVVSASAYAFLGACIIAITIVLGFGYPLFFLSALFIGILGAGVLATVCTSLIGFIAARLVYRFGWDPDSIIPPLTTTVGDMLGIIFIAMSIIQVGRLFPT